MKNNRRRFKKKQKEQNLPDKFIPFLLHFLKNYKFSIFLMLLAPLWLGINNVINASVIKIIIDKVAVSNLDFSEMVNTFLSIILIYISLPILMSIFWRFYNIGEIKLAKLNKDILLEVLEYAENHSYKYFQNHLAGSIANKINDISNTIINVVHTLLIEFFGGIAIITMTSVFMYFIHPFFCLVFLSWSIIFLFISYFTSKRAAVYSERFSGSNSNLIGKVVDSVSNVMLVKLFGRNKYELSYVNKYAKKTVDKNKKLLWYKLKDFIAKDLFLLILQIIIVFLLIYLKSKNLITPGDFAFVFTSGVFVLHAVWRMSYEMVNLMREIGICNQALAIVAKKQDVLDKPEAKSIKVTKGKIEFKSVTFNYSKKVKVFEDLNLTINAGERIGLVGFSGSGKSTLINLIMRYFDVNRGEILIDGKNVADIKQSSLRQNISVIPQDAILFHRTIMENIKYGKLEATKKEVVEASKMARCHEFIMELEDGYDTFVGERGVKLSGGQRQRIAIARAILKNAPILILDEATSALDSITEQCIQENIDKMSRDKTTIAIAHRLSTLLSMDRILVFEEGKIVEDGSHRKLLRKGGRYKELWSMQSGGFIPEDVEEVCEIDIKI